MKQELVRINSIDNIEQPGILYSPNNDTNKIVIHVHGLNGNFYENRFLDTIAKSYTEGAQLFTRAGSKLQVSVISVQKKKKEGPNQKLH